tara:strand:- start:58 stop:1263 length:1206 start_codon:yes stop_codon:yes gene_type:complete
LKELFNFYKEIESNTLNVIKAQFFLQLVASSFFLILNIYLANNKFSDGEIANLISYRFLAVMVLAFPLGFFIRNRILKPLFMIGSFGVPLVALLLVFLIKNSTTDYLYLIFILWGIFYTFFQVGTLPYIMRNTNKSIQVYAISLSFSTHSLATIFSGFCIFILGSLFSVEEGNILILLSLIGFIGIYFVFQIRSDFDVISKKSTTNSLKWSIILKAIIPTFIIAIGAGLTIPFINLFFYHNFSLDAPSFAFVGTLSSILVVISSLYVPSIKKKYGAKKSIINTQLIAVIALILLATTEFFNQYTFVLYFAIFFYLIRTPLMNMAAPLTSEFTMNYVGKHNQEMLSAITSAIWSGSWYFSSQIFRLLIENNFKYYQIFYLTAGLYALGIISYYVLIISSEKK